jgi:hypothetical protein
MSTCQICNETVTDGIHLSNGGTIHEECLESIEAKIKKSTYEIAVKKNEIISLQKELKKREGIGFKIFSVFTKPEMDNAEIEALLPLLKLKIKGLSKTKESLQSSLLQIYDYYLTYPPDWEKRRKEVADRDGEHCSQCGGSLHIHLHHIIPLSKGGSNNISNLKLLCGKCHSATHGGKDFTGEFSTSETAFSKRVANIRFAIDNERKIKFGYKKYSDESHQQRTVKPEAIISVDHQIKSGSTLCVRGYCELRGEERVFALKRMRGLKVI